MNTAQVSVERTTYELPRPFMVIATQNPIDNQGTFPLPESQLDRFMMRLHVGYPDPEFERDILRDPRRNGDLSIVEHVLTGEEVRAMQAGVAQVKIEDSLLDYIVRVVQATRRSAHIELGVSTRGSLSLRNAAQAHAYMLGRDWCVPEDVKAMAVSVLAHRIGIARTFDEAAESMGEGTAAMMTILEETAVPI